MNREERNKYMREWYKKNPSVRNRYSSRRLKFKGKSIMLKDNPRKGICFLCLRTDLQTQIHHYAEYDYTDPLKNTIELCASCHNHIGYRLGHIQRLEKR